MQMQQFSEIIKVDGRELFFVFNRLTAPGEDKFFVIVTKETITYHVDLMKNKFGNWEIVSPAVPEWFERVESSLVEAINRNTAQDRN